MSDFLDVTTSLTARRWVGPTDDLIRQAEALAQHTGLPVALCQTLARRGVTAGEAERFLDPKLKDLLPDPLTLKDMGKAA